MSRFRFFLPLWSGLAGCAESDMPLELFVAECVLHEDNALRARCEFAASRSSEIEVAFSPTDGSIPLRIHTSEEPSSTPVAELFLMVERTDYTWTATELGGDGTVLATGVFTTGTAPDSVLGEVNMSGTSSAAMVGLGSPCLGGAYAQIYATTGELLWYQSLGGMAGFAEGVSFTEDQTVLAIVGSAVREFSLDGKQLMEVFSSDVPGRFHHDAFRKNGLTWVLYNQDVEVEGDELLVDGFVVYDADGDVVADWALLDHHDPVILSDTGRDYSHANAIWVDDEGGALVSSRHLSSVFRVHTDIEASNFGQIDWWMTGDIEGGFGQVFGSDFEFTGDVGGFDAFQQQHNAHLLPDGRLAMFDNGIGRESRLAVLAFDVAMGTVEIEESYSFDVLCPFQGGAWHTEAGNPMATCSPAPQQRALEWNPAMPDVPVWEAQAVCAGEIEGSIVPGIYVPRFVPLEW